MALDWKQRYSKALGINLKKLRLSKNVTQRELSIKSGVSLSHISRIERGVRDPTLCVLKDLAVGLRLHPKVLLDFKFDKDQVEQG